MKKTPAKPATLTNPGDDVDPADKRSPLEKQAERDEQAILDLIQTEGMDGGVAVIDRRTVNEVNFGYVGEMPARNFSRENLKNVYGGGDYKIQFKTAQNKFAGRAEIKIDYRIPALYPGAAAAATEPKAQDRTPELIQAFSTALRQNAPTPPAAPDNTLLIELLKQNGELSRAAMTQRPQTDPALMAALGTLTAAVAELKSNRGGGDNGGGFFKELEKFQAMQELIGSNAGPGEKPDRLVKIIEALAPHAMPFLGSFVNRGGEQQPQPAAVAQPALTAGDPARNPSPTSTDDPTMNPLFKIYLNQFCSLAITAAAKGRNAYEWADAKIDEIDQKYHEPIFKIANAEDWFAKIFGGNPAAQSHLQWLLDMRNTILTRWLVSDVKLAYASTPRPTAEAYATAFMGKVSVSYHDALWDLLEPDAWKQIFAGSDVDAVWIENLRVAFEKDIDDGTETAAEPAAAAGGGGTPDTGAGGSAKPPARKRASTKKH